MSTQNSSDGALKNSGKAMCDNAEDFSTSQAMHPQAMGGEKLRAHPETFADPYGRARKFYVDQSAADQKDMASALAREFRKIAHAEIRERMVSSLSNIHLQLGNDVGEVLGMDIQPAAPSTHASDRAQD